MKANNTVDVNLDHIALLGKELEFASGIRALAAEKVMRERGINDPDELFSACEDLIGQANLFESYSDTLNRYPTRLVLGQGCPFRSLDAYIALREHYGELWVVSALKEYVQRFGTKLELGTTNVEQVVKKLAMRAHICFEYDMVWWDAPTRTPDGYGRYDRTKRIKSLNGYLASVTYKQTA